MIEFTKLNDEVILLNPFQIEYVEVIPESKVIMMNGKFHIIKEGKDEIQRKILEYRRQIINKTDSE